jgi:tRNA(Ile)-lysidine synthase
LRSRLHGDSIALAKSGRKKIKDEFIDRKIPKPVRETIPLLALGSDILWIMDSHGRTSGAYRVTAGCRVLAVTVYN